MQIIRNYQNYQSSENLAITLGNFDGIHLGHQKILSASAKIAQTEKLKFAVVSFNPHPLTILRNKKDFHIFHLKDKLRFLHRSNADKVFLVKFTKTFSQIRAQDFLTEILLKKFHVKHIIIGHDFIFGKDRQGNAEFLKNNAEKLDYKFTQISAEKHQDSAEIYSSSLIRQYLSQGKMRKVKDLLGRHYFIRQRVIAGDARGREMGFATANFAIKKLHKIKYGVYAVRCEITGNPKTYDAVVNFGIRPTFAGDKELLELHILNFEGDLYGSEIKIHFIEFLRAEQKFSDINSLKTQISKDCEAAKTILQNS